MGNATTRTLERVAAAVGMLAAAPIEFQTAWDVPQGGVLLALPALLAQGLLRRPASYQLPGGFYGIDSIFVVLALMALARIRSLEQLRYQAPGEWGKLLGLDRLPDRVAVYRQAATSAHRPTPRLRRLLGAASCVVVPWSPSR